MYRLIYIVPFATLENIPCVVEIEKDGYTGEPTELIAGVTPFTVDIADDEFLYVPTRFSTAKIQVVGSDYLRSLFSTAYREYRVTFKKDGVITWCGFIKPELYTQDYTSETFVLEIECMSAMSVLEFIDYTTEGETKRFVSLWYLLQRCVSEARGVYSAVYFPYVYARDQAEYTKDLRNVLQFMRISEQNFFDEDDKPMKLKEVLEEICKFLGWTCVDWKGDLYFVDVDHTGTYHKYDIGLSDKTNIQINELLVQDIGFAGAEHSLDILPGYNKVTVRCSNYTVSSPLDFDIDYDSLPELVELPDIVTKDDVTHRKLLIPQDLDMIQYTDAFTVLTNLAAYKGNEAANNLMGAIPMRYCSYKMENTGGVWKPNISDYNYTDVMRVRLRCGDGNQNQMLKKAPLLKVKGPCVAYPPGVFCISASVKYVNEDNPDMSPLPKDSWKGPLRLAFKLTVGSHDLTTDSEILGESGFKCSFLDFGESDGQDYTNIINEKALSDPYKGASGKLVYNTIAGGELVGALEFQLLAGMYPAGYGNYGYLLKDLKVKFVPQDGLDESSDADRTYENVLNENYINELDEIELKISSYNKDGACYSKVMLEDGYLNSHYLTDNLYNVILGKEKRPEEMLITRIINHYSTTSIKLTQEIKNSQEIAPFTILSDTYLVGRKFINTGGSIDYKMGRFECVMIEV